MSSMQKKQADNSMTVADFRAQGLDGLWQPRRTKSVVKRVRHAEHQCPAPTKKPVCLPVVKTVLTADDVLTLMLPWPPSLNANYVYAKHRPVLSHESRAYHKAVLQWVTLHRLAGLIGTARVAVEMVLHEPDDGSQHDCDNYSKVLFDALTRAGFWADDKQVRRMVVEYGDRIQSGAIALKVRLFDVLEGVKDGG